MVGYLGWQSDQEREKMTTMKLGELFCGPGGLAWGAVNASGSFGEESYLVRHAWASDYDGDSCRTYARNVCPENPESVLCEDVRTLDISRLSPIDLFAYGFPCNDFSIVGERKGVSGKFGPLYRYGIEVLDRFRPKAFVAENVGGLSSANEGKVLSTILHEMKNAGNGYRLTVHLYKSEEYGVPQTRHRLIIVGFDKSLGLRFRVPAPTTLDSHVSARHALEYPPIPKSAPNQERTSQSKSVVDRLRHILPGQNVWTADLPDHLKLNVRGAKLSQIYRRLHPDKPAYTITGSGGGGTHGYHWEENRALTNRERARIQTFPDDFVFEGSKESVRKQIGMAVPPLLSFRIFEAILKTFAGVDYPCVSDSHPHFPKNSLLNFLEPEGDRCRKEIATA